MSYQSRILLSAAILFALSACGAAQAATIVKANNTTSLAVGTSWVGGFVPGSLDVAQWDLTVTGSNTTTLGNSLYIGEIVILNPGGPVTINNDDNTLALNGISGTGIDMSSATQNLTLNCPVLLGSGQTWNVASGRTLTVSSSGVISGGSGLTIAGSGTTILSGTNTYTGGTTVVGGTIKAGNNYAFGPAGSPITVQPGATLDLGGHVIDYADGNYAITVGGAGVNGNGAVVNSSGTGYVRSVTLSSDTTFGGTSPWDVESFGVSTTLAGNGYNLTKLGSNDVTFFAYISSVSLTVSGVKNINVNAGTISVIGYTTIDNSQPGSIYVNSGGTLSVGNDGYSVTIQKPIVMAGGIFQTESANSNGNATIAAAISLNSTGNIVQQSGSILTLNGAVSDGTASNGISVNGAGVLLLNGIDTYSGSTAINQGTLRLGSSGAIPSGAGYGNVSVAAGAVLDVNGKNASINGLSGGGTVDNLLASASGTLNVGNNNVSSTFSGVLQDTYGTLNVVKSGAGTLTLNGFSNYSGSTTINNGILRLGASNAIPPNTGVTIAAAGTLDVGGQGTNVATLSGSGTVDNSSGNGILNIGSNNGSSTYSGVIQNSSGSLALIKSGSGIFTLAQTNTFGGGTSITAGILRTTVPGAIPSGPSAGNVSVSSGATIDVYGQSITINGLSGSGTVDNFTTPDIA